MYRHIAGVDFNHCEKHSNCRNCSEKQQRACEKEADKLANKIEVNHA